MHFFRQIDEFIAKYGDFFPWNQIKNYICNIRDDFFRESIDKVNLFDDGDFFPWNQIELRKKRVLVIC